MDTHDDATRLGAAHAFASALDASDYDAASKLLDSHCECRTRSGLLAGAESIMGSYREADAWARRHIDRIVHGSAVRPLDADRFRITFVDRLEHGGMTFTYASDQLVELGPDGLIRRISHEEDPACRAALQAFLAAAGVALPGAVAGS